MRSMYTLLLSMLRVCNLWKCGIAPCEKIHHFCGRTHASMAYVVHICCLCLVGQVVGCTVAQPPSLETASAACTGRKCGGSGQKCGGNATRVNHTCDWQETRNMFRGKREAPCRKAKQATSKYKRAKPKEGESAKLATHGGNGTTEDSILCVFPKVAAPPPQRPTPPARASVVRGTENRE